MFNLNNNNNSYYLTMTSKSVGPTLYSIVVYIKFDSDYSYYVDFIVTKSCNGVVKSIYNSDYVKDCIEYYNKL